MPKQAVCPHCSKPIIDDTPDLLAEAIKPLAEAIKGLPSQLPKPAELPPTLAETLALVAQAGQHMQATANSWESQRQAEAERAEAPSHQAPTPELIQHWGECPNCKPAWGKIWDSIAAEARKDYVPSAEAKEAITEVVRQLTVAQKGT